MATTTDQSTDSESTPTLASFGANAWLVEDMYERYLADPASVDAAWHDFFDDYRPTNAAVQPAAAAPAATAPAVAAPAAAPSATTPAPAATPGSRTRRGPCCQARARTRRRSRSGATARRERPRRREHGEVAGRADRDERARRPGQALTTPGVVQLRGAAARVVANMETSLTVPTATSVRAVPAKLIADNRVVINNHLRRSRGGKVSFTHIIGYAVVRALAEYPEMNNYYAEVDGKPAVVTPEHVNFGLAIDLVDKDGLPLARRRGDQGRRDDGLRRVLERLRGHRPPRAHRQADRRRLRRHDDQPDQPRHDRHQPLGAAPDGRARARSSASARWSTRPSSAA